MVHLLILLASINVSDEPWMPKFFIKSLVERNVSVMKSVIVTGNVLFHELRFLKSISRLITGPLSRLPISSLSGMEVSGFRMIMGDG